ncbi:uncharacterized protein LOC106661037 [Cimex lectularius]|uniref:Uncharacterized protein n=1 Tax=Cimex lectularius TaxID=79782 RepID=A0A8I6R6N0_CIMLE|nr:uncharacterized protein LOC106661037 [Cimex lectularius]
MTTQWRKTHLWASALFLAIVLTCRETTAKSWTASWSWPEELPQDIYDNRLSDEAIVDMLYTRPSRSPPDHPTFQERLNYRKELDNYENTLNDYGPKSQEYRDYRDYSEYNDYEDFDPKRTKALSTTYMTVSQNANGPRVTSYAHRIIHKQ